MKPGSWPAIALIYLHGVLASASLSKVIPLLEDVSVHLGASRLQFGLLISLMTVAPALLATVAGSVIDRIGARRVLTAAAVIGVIANFAYLQVDTLDGFMAIRIFEGLLVVGIYSAAPALIMATTGDARRGRAMAVWSTYTPAGISLGLALSAGFAGTAHWRGSYLVHLLLFGALACAGGLLPHSPAGKAAGPAVRPGLFSTLTQPGPLRLALTFSALLMMGFGMNTVFPDWFALQHQVPVGRASTIVAVVNLMMIPGGLLAGWMLARGRSDAALLAVLMLAAVAVSVPLFMPGVTEPLRIAAMAGWLLAQGGAIAVITSTLPRVVASPLQGAAAAGLLSQVAALTTFVTPLIWRPILESRHWTMFLVVTGISAFLALALFPRRNPAGH